MIDVFPPSAEEPVRLDLFGDTLESIRAFDPETQRSTKQLKDVSLLPVSEALLDKDGDRAASAPAIWRPSARRATIRSTPPSAKAAAGPAWSTGCRCSIRELATLFDYLPAKTR